MPILKPSERSNLSPLGPTLSLDDRVAHADEVLRMLDSYLPKEFPERPEILTYDDGQLVSSYKANERGDKLGREAKEQLRYFATWRNAVWLIEGKHQGNLTLLIGTVETLEAADRFEDSKLLRDFMRTHYAAILPELCPLSGSKHARCFVERFAENRTVLPLWLRTMQKPPPGRGTRVASEAAPQRDLYGYARDDDE